MNSGIIWKSALIGGGLLLIGTKLMAMNRAADKLDISAMPRFKRFNLKEGIVLDIDVEIRNPNNTSLHFKQPIIRVLVGTVQLGSSRPQSATLSLNALDSRKLEPIEVTLPPIGWVSAGIEVADLLKLKKEVELKIESTTHAVIFGQTFPVKDEMKFKLKF